MYYQQVMSCHLPHWMLVTNGLRSALHEVDPQKYIDAKLIPSWRPPSDSHTHEFAFASGAPSLDERIWDLYHHLPFASLLVDLLYKGTKWEWRVNAYGGHGDKVPAVKTYTGATINCSKKKSWHRWDNHSCVLQFSLLNRHVFCVERNQRWDVG